ncbi:hypothetical protein [Paraburkholderia sp. BCC1886]|uniref:hypothetical protein n=1 Tax=Paraburkholderia sp. BCC1886 TaxID=2562670 RepID=UPI0021B2897A|nr:hypothetical protein [Paraburkholderia sp. BCC1886]
MCGMCGLLGGGNHWSNTTAPVSSTTGAGSAPNTRRQRLLQAALANRILVPLRLRLDDFHGQSFMLSSPTGASEMVGDFAQVWKTAERMLGRPLDPLTMFAQTEANADVVVDAAVDAAVTSQPEPV